MAEPIQRYHPPIMQFFAFEHLKPELQGISKPFYDLAERIIYATENNPERDMCLRKLLEAKDCAVRAYIYKEPSNG